MSTNYFNLFFSRLELQTLPKMDCKFIINEPFVEYIFTNFYGGFLKDLRNLSAKLPFRGSFFLQEHQSMLAIV